MPPSTLLDGITAAPLASAEAGVANQPISLTDVPAVRFQSVVRPTLGKTFAAELSVMLAIVVVAVVGLTANVDSLVALSVTVAVFESRPTCAWALLAIARARATAPARARFKGCCIVCTPGVKVLVAICRNGPRGIRAGEGGFTRPMPCVAFS